MIKLQIIGNLGKDCIEKDINGKHVINFSVAHTEKFKDAQGNPKDKTTWVECAYWTDRNAVAQYLVKGKMVFVEGTPEADAYANKEGLPAATLRLRVQNLQLLGGNTDNSQQASSQSYASSNAGNVTYSGNTPKPAMRMPQVAEMPADDDLPF